MGSAIPQLELMPKSHHKSRLLNCQQLLGGFPGVSAVRNLPALQGTQETAGLIPGSGRSPGRGHGNHASILAWKIPWTEELGGLQSMQLQGVGHD